MSSCGRLCLYNFYSILLDDGEMNLLHQTGLFILLLMKVTHYLKSTISLLDTISNGIDTPWIQTASPY